VPAPVRAVVGALLLGVLAHLAGIAAVAADSGRMPLSGLGAALSFAALLLALTLLLVELVAREVTLTLVAAPLAAIVTSAAAFVGLHPLSQPSGMRGVWLEAHIALSFAGMAAFATAAAAGAMYLVERRELRSRRFGAIFRFFPPLETLDRVNHVAAVAGMLGLTLGVVLAATYSLEYRTLDLPKVMWALGAWLAASAVAIGRLAAGWRARRAAVVSTASFVLVIALYIAVRASVHEGGRFL